MVYRCYFTPQFQIVKPYLVGSTPFIDFLLYPPLMVAQWRIVTFVSEVMFKDCQGFVKVITTAINVQDGCLVFPMLSVLPGTKIDVTGYIPTVCHLTDGNITDWLSADMVGSVVKLFCWYDSRYMPIVLVYGETKRF